LGFVAAANNSVGTLTISDGTHAANILLLGQYMASQFHITNDGSGGTLVTDPPATTPIAIEPSRLAVPRSV
jgi:hypothetical protein